MTVTNRFAGSIFASAILILSVSGAYASVVITGTRVIYPSDANEVSIKMNNNGESPVLVQSWLDKGDINAKPENLQVPFTLTPPINRVDAGKGQTLRLNYTGTALPNNKESIFWLNVLEVPAKTKQSDKNLLQMAFRTRIKVFFRPSGLSGNANDAVESLVWNTTPNGLKVTNPTPFYVSLSDIAAQVNGKIVNGELDMVEPKASREFQLNDFSKISHGSKIDVNYINDYGAVGIYKAVIQ